MGQLFPFVWSIQKLCSYLFHFTRPNWIFDVGCIVLYIFTSISVANHTHSQTHQIIYISSCVLYFSIMWLNRYICILCVYLSTAHSLTLHAMTYMYDAFHTSFKSCGSSFWEPMGCWRGFRASLFEANVFVTLLLVSSFVSVILNECVLILCFSI